MSGEVTRLLADLRTGDRGALDRLIPLLYGELRSIAHLRLRKERRGHTLSTTALVNEVYLRLLRQQKITAEDRAQLFAVAGNTMRRILVDYARTRKRLKRGGGEEPLPLDEVEPFLSDPEVDELLALDDALERLAVTNPRGAQVVEHRFYGGLTLEETAVALGVAVKTVQRSWVVARAWLRKEIARQAM